MCKLKRRRNNLLAVLLLIFMLMQTAVPIAAADTTIPSGDYTISSDGTYQLDSGYSGVISVADSVYEATIIGDVYGAATFSARIEIESRNSDLNLVIQDLKINATGQGIYLDTASGDIDICLYISGECSIEATGAGICAQAGTSFIIDSYSGDDDNDILTVRSTGWNAGIGGADGIDGGSITIAGGTITAYGGQLGAGIGGGHAGDGGTIIISGGKVTANGGASGAGIGGGSGGSGGIIEISGGVVTASGGDFGAGIGGGESLIPTLGSGGTVTISNHPTIIATGDTASQAQNIGHGTVFDASSGTLQDRDGNDLSYLRFHVTDMDSGNISGATVNVDGNDYFTNDDGLTGCTVLLDGSTAQDYSACKPGYYITQSASVIPSAMNVEVPVALEAGTETDLAVDVAYMGSYTFGEGGMYIITVVNYGPAASISAIAVSDAIPAGFTVNTCFGGGWTCNMAGGVLTANYSSSLAEGAIASFTVDGIITGSAGSTLCNTATVSTGDTNPSNNSDTVSFIIQAGDSSITPTTAAFDKYSGSDENQDIAVSMTLNGNTLSGIKNGGNDLAAGTDYTVSGSTVTINQSYLAQQAVGTTTLTFDFSAGTDQSLDITISDSTPAINNSSISPITAAFDKYSGSANYQDIAVSMTLNGNTLSGITNGGNDLAAGTDYTVSGGTVTINQSYLAQQAVRTTTLTFDFSAGTDQSLDITISDSTPSSNGGGGGGSSSQTVNSTTGSAKVYPSQGGKISLGNEVTLDIPKGALQGSSLVPVTIEKTDISQALPSSFKLLGQAYEFEVGGENSYNFGQPVTLTFTFDPDQVPPGESPAIYYYDPVTLQWVKLGGTISGHTITIEIDHFTIFAVLAEQSGASSGLEEISLSDINGHWAEETIKEMIAQGSIGGYPDGTFKPDQPISRAEFVSVLVKALGLQTADSGTAFSDIENHWAEPSINIAAANGIIGGYDDKTFRPDDPITREQMASIIVNAAKLDVSAEETSFADNASISAWAKGSAAAAASHGLMSGYPDSTFKPQGQATRAEAVTVILKLTK